MQQVCISGKIYRTVVDRSTETPIYKFLKNNKIIFEIGAISRKQAVEFFEDRLRKDNKKIATFPKSF